MTNATPIFTDDETQIMGLYNNYQNLKRLLDEYSGDEDSIYHEYHINCQKLAEQISKFKSTSLICCQIQLQFASTWNQENVCNNNPDIGDQALFTAATQLRNIIQPLARQNW